MFESMSYLPALGSPSVLSFTPPRIDRPIRFDICAAGEKYLLPGRQQDENRVEKSQVEPQSLLLYFDELPCSFGRGASESSPKRAHETSDPGRVSAEMSRRLSARRRGCPPLLRRSTTRKNAGRDDAPQADRLRPTQSAFW